MIERSKSISESIQFYYMNPKEIEKVCAKLPPFGRPVSPLYAKTQNKARRRMDEENPENTALSGIVKPCPVSARNWGIVAVGSDRKPMPTRPVKLNKGSFVDDCIRKEGFFILMPLSGSGLMIYVYKFLHKWYSLIEAVDN